MRRLEDRGRDRWYAPGMSKSLKAPRRATWIVIVSIACVGIGLVLGGYFERSSLEAKAQEVSVNLERITALQAAAKKKFGRYISAAASLAKPGTQPQPWDVLPCDAACSPEQPDACRSFDCLGFEPEGPVYYAYACEVTEAGGHFICAALGDVDGDGEYSLYITGPGTDDDEAEVPDFDGLSPGCFEATGDRVQNCAPGIY